MSDDTYGDSFFGTGTVVSEAGLNMIDIDSYEPRSVLFAGLAGSARLHEKLGSTEALRAVDRCLKRMERAVGAFGGRVVKMAGDELMAVFDFGDEVAQAAMEMQERVADLPAVSGVKLAIRVGFAPGVISEEAGEFTGEAVDAAAHLAGLAKAGQVLTNALGQAALSAGVRKSTRDLGLTDTAGTFSGTGVYELFVPEPRTVARSADIPAERLGEIALGTRLTLRYCDAVIVLDGQNPLINMGRDVESNLVIHDRRASRHHAKIEWRGDKVVLIDKSTNGTFVTLPGKPELFVRRGECVLRGKGLICFAASAKAADADFAEFEQD